MASSAVGIIGPLAFVVVLELAQLAREIPLEGNDGRTESLDYDDQSGIGGRVLTRVAGWMDFDGLLVSAGGFYVVYLLTELVLYGSVAIVYLTTGPLFGKDLQDVGTGLGITLFLVLVWMVLPIIVVDRYDDLADRGIRPLSVNVHVATTLLYVAFLVALTEGSAVLGIEASERTNFVFGIVFGLSTGLMTTKSQIYRQYLRKELENLEADATGESSAGDGTVGGTTTSDDYVD